MSNEREALVARHPVSQIEQWADMYEREGGHALIVQMLRSYAALAAPQQEPVAGRCVAPPCKCNDENRRKCAYWHEAPQPDGVVVPREPDVLTTHRREAEQLGMHRKGPYLHELNIALAHIDELRALLAAAKEQK